MGLYEEQRCSHCGRPIKIVNKDSVYKMEGRYYCSWSCYRLAERLRGRRRKERK